MSGEKLKTILDIIMDERGLTKTDIASKLEMTPQHLNQALNVADVKSGLLEKICKAFGISIASLYGETSNVAITGSGSGVNVRNNDTEMVTRFLAIIEEKDRQIAQLISKI